MGKEKTRRSLKCVRAMRLEGEWKMVGFVIPCECVCGVWCIGKVSFMISQLFLTFIFIFILYYLFFSIFLLFSVTAGKSNMHVDSLIRFTCVR